MYLCDSDHEEVCYEGRECPVCKIIEEYDEQITDLEKDVERLESQVEDLEKELQNGE
jgi:polyhydroxyalkanoate synthesis regulator phasin